MREWGERARAARERYADGEARVNRSRDADARQRQLTRMGNAAYAAGLAALMDDDPSKADEWLARAAERWRESFADAPPGSWGRPIGALKARLIAGDLDGARREAEWALALGPADGESPIGRYAGALALLALARDEEARPLADVLRTHDGFPAAVGDALAMLAAQDTVGYVEAVEAVLESFETRDEYLEDMPVADTVLALQALAAERGMAAELASPLLPR